MADWLLRVLAGRLVSLAVERPADELFGSETDCEGQCQNNPAEQNPKRQTDDTASDTKIVDRNGRGESCYHPLHADAQKARVLQIHIDSPNENAALEKSRDDATGRQNDQR